jgi:hypothetical protein
VQPHLLAIEWTDPESKGFIDLFAEELFSSAAGLKGVVHPVVGRKGDSYRAKCNISVAGKSAELDYESFPEENKRWGMYLGVTRLTFSSLRRDKITKIEWKGKGKRRFLSKLAKIVSSPLGKPGAYKLSAPDKKKARRDVIERPGQAKFKSRLMVVYDRTCCISGCSVGEALDAAHIDQYYGSASDHPQNGLLLRRDLHALFDANLLGIHPESHTVHLSRDVLSSGEYVTVNGRSLRTPKYGGMAYAPSKEALRRRWKNFNK